MFFLNLTAGEFFVLFGTLGGIIATLYLLDRTKRKKIVSTLRFWTPASGSGEQQNRRRVREPWSLVLQLLGLVLLLLAIAQLQLGTRQSSGVDHVLLLDTSSWTAERVNSGTLLDTEKRSARQYLAGIPSRDRVLLVRVDGLATPVTSFTTNRSQLLKALNESSSAWTALNIDQALSFAARAQRWSGGRGGEIVYIGPGKINESENPSARALPNLRTITVPVRQENCGIRHISVRRSESDANSWQATVTVKNYGSLARTIRLATQFAGTDFRPRLLTLQPEAEIDAEYGFITTTSGRLIAEITPSDDLPSDNRAVVALPSAGALKVAVFSDRPAALRPLLEANHRLQVQFFSPAQYNATLNANITLLDRFAPSQAPKVPSLFIDPPKAGSPLPIKQLVSSAVIKSWHPDSALTTGLHARETRLPKAEVFETFAGDIPVGSLAEGPFVVARGATDAHPKLAVLGFDPLDPQLRFEVTTPLLFANILRWLAPESFQTSEVSAAQTGTATVTLDPSEQANTIRITDERGFAVPFSIKDQTLQVFVSSPSILRIVSNNRERVLSLTLPDVADADWKPTAAATGIPAPSPLGPHAIDTWQWLAVLGGTVLLIEWLLFGRRRRLLRFAKPSSSNTAPTPAQHERELVAK